MNLYYVAWLEIKRRLKSIPTLIGLFCTPLVIIFILGSSLWGLSNFKMEDRQPEKIIVGIHKEDAGMFRQGVDLFLQRLEEQNIIEHRSIASRQEMVREIHNGTIHFGVMIPNGFSDRVIHGESANWELIYGNDYTMNLTASTLFQTFLDKFNMMQVTAMTLQQPLVNLEAFAAAGGLNETYITNGSLNNQDKRYSAFQYYSVSMLVMMLLYTGRDAAVSVMAEKENGTLQRLQSMPVPPVIIVLGKILGNTLIAFIQALLIILITQWLYGVDWGQMWGWLIAFCLLIILSAMCLGMVILLKAKTARSVHSVYQYIIIAMTAVSGGFRPIESLEAFSKLTVSHWGMQGMLRIMLDSELSVIIQQAAVLGIFCIILFLVSIAAYRKVVSYE